MTFVFRQSSILSSRVATSLAILLISIGMVLGEDQPTTAREWTQRGNALAADKQWQPAIAAFTEAIKLAPKRSELYVNRAVAYEKLGDWKAAEAECTTAIKFNFEDTRAFLQRAIARSEQGENEAAFEDASRAARMEPDNAQCVFIRFLTASRAGRFDLGHTAGETYIGIQGWADPFAPYVALLNYVALRRAGNESAADSILAEAAASLPANVWPAPVIHYLRGQIDAETMLSLAPDRDRETLARYYLGFKEWLGGDSAKAREQFEWIRAHGDHDFLQFKLAGDYLKELGAAAQKASPTSKE